MLDTLYQLKYCCKTLAWNSVGIVINNIGQIDVIDQIWDQICDHVHNQIIEQVIEDLT